MCPANVVTWAIGNDDYYQDYVGDNHDWDDGGVDGDDGIQTGNDGDYDATAIIAEQLWSSAKRSKLPLHSLCDGSGADQL